MADEDLLVTISGPALSLLLFENARCVDQIGFLLGEIQIFATKTVTDSERAVERIKTHINIKSIVPHPMGSEAFFNTTGQLDEERLKEFLKDHLTSVVGWYHYRCNFPLIMNSLRDRNLHTGLSVFFSKLIELQRQENFLFFLMATTQNETCATHKFKHLLYRKEGRDFKPVSFSINNLGADASRPDGSDYKPTPIQSSCQQDSFNKVYDPLRNDLKQSSGVQAVQLIEKSAESLLAKLVVQVNKTDKTVTELSEKLFVMKHQFAEKKFEKLKTEELLRLRLQQVSMDVDIPASQRSPWSPSLPARPEPKSPESPLMIDSRKVSASSSNIKTATKKNLKQDSNEERMRDSIPMERETNQMNYGGPRSPSPTFSNTEWKTVMQRKAELEQSNNSSCSFDKQFVRKSPDYNGKNS